MANILTRLKIREVSSVDRPANPGAKIMLMKRGLSEQRPAGDTVATDPHRPRQGQGRRTLFVHQQQARAAYGSAPNISKPTPAKKPRPRVREKEKSMPVLTPAVEAYLKKNVITAAEAIAKRKFTADERKDAAAKGHAMPDGGYPIEDVGDLHNAIQAIGRAKNPGATRAHVRRQAARLGQSDLIPDDWGKKVKNKRHGGFGGHGGFSEAGGGRERRRRKALLKTMKYLDGVLAITKDSVSFDQILAEMGSTDYAEGVIEAVRDSCHALKDSIESIAECDDMAPDEKAQAIKESFGQFMDHLSTVAPDNVTKAFKEGIGPMKSLSKRMKKTFTSVPAHDATPPTKDGDVKTEEGTDPAANTGMNEPKTATSKQLRKAAKKLEKRVAAAEQRFTSLMTMEKASKDYMDHPDQDMDDEEKKKFVDMTPKDRAKFMKDRPIAQLTEKRIAALPEPVRKELEAGKSAAADVAKMREETEVAEFAKRASDLGQGAEFGTHLRTLAKNIGTEEDRTKAFDAVMSTMAALNEQVRVGKLFGEFGSGSIITGSAYEQLMAKADELMGTVNKALPTGSKPLTKEQAFDRVYSDPANRDLVAKYKAEANGHRAAA